MLLEELDDAPPLQNGPFHHIVGRVPPSLDITDEPKLRKTLLATEMEKSVSVNYVVPKVTS